MEKQILNILSELVEGQKKLVEGQNKMNDRLDSLEIQVKENTQILRSLEESSQVHKAEMDHLTHDIAEIKGDVKEIRKDLTNVEVITASNWSDIAKLKAIK